ncbi:MAG: hypothetical protein OEV30_11870, partial [Ignavibacteria bacterium]|nr:hypothetical protein [Ignavibacteria bacterium]
RRPENLFHHSSGSRLTGRVMEQVLRPPADSLSYRLLKGLAYIAPMTIVLVILGAVFSLTGVIDLQEGSTGGGRLGDTVGIVGRVSQEATSALIDLLRNYAPFMTNGESLGITFAILVVLTMLAFIDRLIGTRVGGRAR